METWLSPDILASEVAISNYSLVRLDRHRHGGGVAIYIHNCFQYNIVLSGPADLELVVVSVSKPGFNLCLGVFYRPPSSASTIFDSCLKPLLLLTSLIFLILFYLEILILIIFV